MSGPSIAPALALLWAGIVLGGSLIAAPAKFQAPSLSFPVALDVGRAQFLWIGITEGVLCAAFLLAQIIGGGVNWKLAAVPFLLLLAQRFIIMPPLDARTLQFIAGQSVGESYLHLVFIAMEIIKLLVLFAIAWVGFSAAGRS
ncbi:MAG: hypothetical protein ACK4HG_01220 [Agrobacterium albertimagni]|nr:hypothetical protein [Amphiplicatus sp.]